MSFIIQALQQQVEHLDNEILNVLATLKDEHNEKDQQWIRTLISNTAQGTSDPVIEAGIIVNITIIDTIIAKLLKIESRTLAKAKALKDYISDIWQNNGGNIDQLNGRILTDD